ncbi:hypothetical protein OC846_003686 [Tilletia horrida]|uniref:Uncharacterized protein n=1 Tax=Tilletia horrida TaxID=155126 RepID=A0AAN6GUD7_9BASI|nr:hypothetical protein OC846_003686 [Tilletia horrida]KAK0564912.1 hypothetical protein OC861_004025 [Tilletia horrida]
MDNAFFAMIVGAINVDSVTKAQSRYYAFTAQHPSENEYGPEGRRRTRVDYIGKLWADAEPPQVDDIVHVCGPWLPHPTPYIHASQFAIMNRGPIPDSFDAPLPIVILLGKVLAWDAERGAITLQTAEYDRNATKRVTFEVVVFRRGKLFANAPEPRVGSVILAHGPVAEQMDVSSKWAIKAMGINYLPITPGTGGSGTVPDTPTKKRKYERKNKFGSNIIVDDADELSGSEAPIAGPSTPGPIRSSARTSGKDRSLN